MRRPRSQELDGTGDEGDVADLIALMTEAQFIALAEAFGGTRVYLPKSVGASHPIARAIGHDTTAALIEAIGCGTLHVPIAREMRARHYRAAGLSYERIALKLGMTRSGVERIFKRIRSRE